MARITSRSRGTMRGDVNVQIQYLFDTQTHARAFTQIVEGSEPCVATDCTVVMHDDDGRSPILEPPHATP